MDAGTTDQLEPLAPGDVFDGRYLIAERVGRGAAGIVFRARDQAPGSSEDDVAIKIVASASPDASNDGLDIEFSLLARLSHPNLVRMHRLGRSADGVTYVVAEYVEGPTMDEATRNSPPGDLLALTHGILQALDHLHRHGYVHQDIKPSNILIAGAGIESNVDRWLPKVADLGVATLRGADPRGKVSGTIPYLAPERLCGAPADPRSDLWALGITLYRCATGRLPFFATDLREAKRLLNTRRIKPLRDVRVDAPPELERLVARMLARDPRDRYRDAAEALADLGRALAHAELPIPEPPVAAMVENARLVGRDAILARVESVIAGASRSQSRLALVRGPSGSGRSRLLAEAGLAAQLSGAVVAIVEPGLGLSPWTSAIARITGTGPATGVDLADAISSALHSLPAVLVVDDLDRRDELATHILERAAPALAATPIAHTAGIIATVSVHGWRPVDPTGISEAELRPLDAADTAAWCASVLGEQPAESLIEYVVARAGGSPALAVETMRDLLDSGALSRVGGNWFFDEDRAGAIESRSRDRRLDGLSARERSVLEALAIFSGRPVALDVLASVSDVEPPELAAAIERLCSAQLARVAEGRLLPTSEAVRAHCERALSARRRTGLHRRAHSALARAGETDPSALCAHALAAGARDVAIDLAARAADAGLARDDYLAALAATELGERAAPDAEIRRAFLLRRARAMVGLLRPADAASTAAEVLSQDPGNREAALIFARALVTAGDGLRARPAIAELAAVGADPLEVATLEVEAAWLLRNPAEVIELGEALLARLASDPSRDPQRARVHLTMSQATVGTGDPQRATVEATRASELFERHSDFAGVATAQAFLAAAADVVGDDAALDTHLARGLDAAHRSGSHSAASRLFNIRGISRLWGGLNDDAAEAFAEAERRGRRAGLAKVSAAAAGNLVAVHRRQGLFGSALQAAARSIRIKRQFDDKNAVLTTVSNITAVLNQLGSFEAAVGGSRRVLSHASEIGDGRMMAHATLERGWIEIERDNAEVGLELIARLDRDETLHMDARNADAVDIIRCIGLARVGERPRALDILRDIADRAHDRYDVAWACYERGAILGDVGQEDLRRAVEQAHACNAREYAWCALARLGLVFLAAGRTQDARLELRRAKEIRDEILADLPVRHRARYLGTRRHAELSAAVDRAAVEFAGEDWPAPAEPGDEDDEGTGATSAITTPSSPSGEDPA